MRLDRDEFVVTYDPAKVEPASLIATIRICGGNRRVDQGEIFCLSTINDSIPFSYFGRESPAEMPHLVLFITAAEHQVFSEPYLTQTFT